MNRRPLILLLLGAVPASLFLVSSSCARRPGADTAMEPTQSLHGDERGPRAALASVAGQPSTSASLATTARAPSGVNAPSLATAARATSGVNAPSGTGTPTNIVGASSRGVTPSGAGALGPHSAASSAAPVAENANSTLLRRTNQEGMLLVPGGEFTMGIDVGGEEDEHPAHRVRVESYYLDRLEVTVEEYLQCVKAGRCRKYREDAARSFRAGDDARFRTPKQPISGVSWDDAVAYCGFVGKRLPREAEWERAASGDDRRHFVWGNQAPDPTRYGCFMRAVGPRGQTTCDVGSFPEGAGPYGHLDLAGNVWEWTADDYDPYAYRRSTANEGKPGSCQQILAAQDEIRASKRHGFTGSNPVPTTCEKVLRGGAFNYPGPGLRVTNRVHHPGTWRMLVAGFRCAKDVE